MSSAALRILIEGEKRVQGTATRLQARNLSFFSSSFRSEELASMGKIATAEEHYYRYARRVFTRNKRATDRQESVLAHVPESCLISN